MSQAVTEVEKQLSVLRILGNIIWFIGGGLLMGLGWWIVGVIMFISIIGIPWGRACFVIGKFSFLPFGKEIVDREKVTGQADIGTGSLGTLGNIVWFIFGGIWLALGHIISAVAYCLTIIGIPLVYSILSWPRFLCFLLVSR